MSRALALRALEAVEHGDRRYAVELLLELADGSPRRGPPRCRVCGQRAWPGDMRGHRVSAHDRHDAGGDLGWAA